MKAKKFLALALAAALALSVAGCSVPGQTTPAASTPAASTPASSTPAASTPAASGEKVFRYAVSSEATSLDQQKTNSVGDNELVRSMQELLVRVVDGQIEPAGAESWEISPDGLTYTFHLRENKWSDGQPVVAGDYVYALQRLMDPATASPYSFIGEYIVNAREIEVGEKDPSELGATAPDDSTLVLQLVNPTAYFLSLLGSASQFTPCRKDYVEQYGETFAADGEKNVYSGPYKLVSSANQVYIFEPNEYFWNAEKVGFDRVEVNVIADSNTQVAMYNNGELDYLNVPTEQVPAYDDVDEAYMNGSEDWVYINAKSDNKVLGNSNFRLALNYALNRVTYNQLANNNVYEPWGNEVMPMVSGVKGFYGDEYTPNGYPLEGDAAKAQEYLQAAMSELGIASPSDITIQFTTSDNAGWKKIAEVIQEQWQTTLGIKVEIRQVTYSEIYSNVYPTHDFEVGYGGWSPDYPDPYTYLELFISDNVYNYSNYANAEFDELMKSTRTETDAQKRMDTLAKAEQILLDDGAVVPLQLRNQHYLLDDDIGGVNFYFSGFNIDWAYGYYK